MPTVEQVNRIARLAARWNVKLGTEAVCKGHTAPAYILAQRIYDRPPVQVTHGPRGGGKSFLSALEIHLNAIMQKDHNFRILGGSVEQSLQIYEALRKIQAARPDDNLFESINKRAAKYRTGPEVVILAAAETSVRGPHVQSLFLDEIEQIADKLRDDAIGMAMELHGISASIAMTSTWNKPSGPMSRVIKKSQEHGNPFHTFCLFDVLERCPEHRSGPNLENCPKCPIVQWCHSDIAEDPLRRPKAKRSNGHYTIASLIQKTIGASARAFESDYLCWEPRSSLSWFTEFSRARHASDDKWSEYRRDAPFHVAIDGGVHTGAVLFQSRKSYDGSVEVNVFADYFAENIPGGAEANAKAINRLIKLCTGLEPPHRQCRISMDPAMNARTATGPSVISEYERARCVCIDGTVHRWPVTGEYRPKADGLAFVEALLMSAGGQISLKTHSRCQHLIPAFASYERAQIDGQILDRPKDPQHPFEEMIDAITGGLTLEYMSGRDRPIVGKQVRVGTGGL